MFREYLEIAMLIYEHEKSLHSKRTRNNEVKRMRKMKKAAALMLAGVLLFTVAGCENSEGLMTGKKETDSQPESAKGRYVEQQLDTPDNFSKEGSIQRLEDGSIAIMDTVNGTVNISADGGNSWEIEENEVLMELAASEDVELTAAIMAADGSIFISYISWDESSDEKLYPEKYIYLDPEGNRTDMEIGIDNFHTCVTKALFSENGRLFLSMIDFSVYELDYANQSAKKILDADGMGVVDIFPCGNTIVITDGSTVSYYDAEKGELSDTDTVLSTFIRDEGSYPDVIVLGAGKDDMIYAACKSGIYSHMKEGSVMEQLADGELCSLSDPSKTPDTLLVMEDGSILILYSDGELDSYVYDPEASVVPEQQLTVYMLYDNDTVRQAISLFRKEYPDVYVKVEVGMTGSDAVTANDAIKNLNTELLSGAGPDLILLDGMPVDSYIEKGMLLDLSELVKALEENGQYYENILEAYADEQGMYAVPIRFALPLLTGSTEIVSGITDLDTLADAVENQATSGVEETVFGTYTPEETLARLYILSEKAWYNEDGSVNKDAVSDFFTQAKRIYEADQMALDENAIEAHLNAQIWRYDYASTRPYDKVQSDGETQQLFLACGQQMITGGMYEDMSSLKTLYSVNNMLGNYTIKPFTCQQQGVFVPYGIAGISSNSKEAELAGEFLKTLLGTEVQSKDLGDGFPVNKDAFSSFTENPHPDIYATVGLDGADGSMIQFNIIWPSEEEISEIESIFYEMDIPADLDYSIYDEVISIGRTILTGEKEFNEGVEEICTKLALSSAE